MRPSRFFRGGPRTALLLGLLVSLTGITSAEPAAILLIVADQHSADQRSAQLLARVDALRAAHPSVPMAMLIDGDAFEHGNPVALRSAGAIDFALLAALAHRLPTILNIGNHEAEFQDLPTTVARLEAAGVTVITNLRETGTDRALAPASTRLTLGERTFVFAGIATDDLATYPAEIRPALQAPEPVPWARDHLARLFAGADQPVVLSHAGIAADRAILPLVPDGTLFAGAHNHLRFVHHAGRTVYFHSGYWNEFLSVATLEADARGDPAWSVVAEPINDADPAEPGLAALIAETRARFLTAADLAVVGTSTRRLATGEAALLAVAAVRDAAHADAALIGNTTFGAGLPAGDVTRVAFDAWVRFDGALCVAEVDGRRLASLLATANQNERTPFAERRGEFLYAVGPPHLDPTATYRIVTNDWGAKNSERYFGRPAITWTTLAEPRLKAVAAAALNP